MDEATWSDVLRKTMAAMSCFCCSLITLISSNKAYYHDLRNIVMWLHYRYGLLNTKCINFVIHKIVLCD